MTTYFLIVFFNAIKNADWGGGFRNYYWLFFANSKLDHFSVRLLNVISSTATVWSCSTFFYNSSFLSIMLFLQFCYLTFIFTNLFKLRMPMTISKSTASLCFSPLCFSFFFPFFEGILLLLKNNNKLQLEVKVSILKM